jgi:hypothetical protein
MVEVSKKEHRLWLMLPFVAFFIIALSIYFFKLKKPKTAMNHKPIKKSAIVETIKSVNKIQYS